MKRAAPAKGACPFFASQRLRRAAFAAAAENICEKQTIFSASRAVIRTLSRFTTLSW
jgi:hypothetical protein